MSKKSIDSVKVASPCSENWEQMEGNDKVRFCSHCAKHVNNLSSMTRKEAMRLVASSNGNICIKYITDPATGRPVFADRLLQISRRTPGIAAGVMSASFALSAHAYAQSTEPATKDPIAIERLEKTEPVDSHCKLSGTVTDPNGAVIPNSEVSITDTEGHSFSVRTDMNGAYTFANLAAGVYQVRASATGFEKHETVASVVSSVDSVVDIPLSVASQEIVVDVNGGETVLLGTMGITVATLTEYRNPLTNAVARDDLDGARQEIIYGRDPNVKEKQLNKGTPLFIAVGNGNAEMVDLLLSFRARVNVRNADKQTPLMQLDYDATPELVSVLRRYGAKINLVDTSGNTALMHATENSVNKEVLQALIDAGADVNLANKAGETALMFAAANDDAERVRMLILAGARVNERTKGSESALDRASSDEIREVLIGFGAQPAVPAN